MFWVIFDTSTKADYYKDVHNLLALPRKAIITYDYNRNIISEKALETVPTGNDRVLLMYAQHHGFVRGGTAPSGPLKHSEALWVGTRLATLVHIRESADRRFFDLEVGGYPGQDPEQLKACIQNASEVPFAKWVSICDRDTALDALTSGNDDATWAATVDALSAAPSQFANDSFWRIKSVSGRFALEIEPTRERLTNDAPTRAIYQVHEHHPLRLSIQTRASVGAKGDEVKRTIVFRAADGSPLSAFNKLSAPIRRFSTDNYQIEVEGTDRLDALETSIELTTTATSTPAIYVEGPSVTLNTRVSKDPVDKIFAIALLILGAILLGAGLIAAKDHPNYAVALCSGGIVAGVVGWYIWARKLNIPSGKK